MFLIINKCTESMSKLELEEYVYVILEGATFSKYEKSSIFKVIWNLFVLIFLIFSFFGRMLPKVLKLTEWFLEMPQCTSACSLFPCWIVSSIREGVVCLNTITLAQAQCQSMQSKDLFIDYGIIWQKKKNLGTKS